MSLHVLAQEAGLAPRWKDVHGRWNVVADDTLRLVLGALTLPAWNEADIADSLRQLRSPSHLPPLVTGDCGGVLHLPVSAGAYELTLEHGGTVGGMAGGGDRAEITLPDEPGYHQLAIGDERTVVAVAPRSGWTVADAAPGAKPWGLAAQLYSLRRRGDGGLGDFGGLEQFVRSAAARGAAAVAISPVHAQFSATPDRYSPYSPSSRTLLNVLHAKLDVISAQREAHALVDWPGVTADRLSALNALYTHARDGGALWDEFTAFRAAQGGLLEGHARFEALHAEMAPAGRWHWRDWPDGFSDAASAAVATFAARNEHEVTRHAFYQFIADRSLAAAQRTAQDAGMGDRADFGPRGRSRLRGQPVLGATGRNAAGPDGRRTAGLAQRPRPRAGGWRRSRPAVCC